MNLSSKSFQSFLFLLLFSITLISSSFGQCVNDVRTPQTVFDGVWNTSDLTKKMKLFENGKPIDRSVKITSDVTFRACDGGIGIVFPFINDDFIIAIGSITTSWDNPKLGECKLITYTCKNNGK